MLADFLRCCRKDHVTFQDPSHLSLVSILGQQHDDLDFNQGLLAALGSRMNKPTIDLLLEHIGVCSPCRDRVDWKDVCSKAAARPAGAREVEKRLRALYLAA